MKGVDLTRVRKGNACAIFIFNPDGIFLKLLIKLYLNATLEFQKEQHG